MEVLSLAKTNLTMESTVEEWLDDPVGIEILRKHVPTMADSPRIRQAGAFPLSGLFTMVPPGSIPDGTAEAVEADLEKEKSE